MEMIDIFDADLRPLGIKERKAAHMDGDWHVTYHLWVVGEHGNGNVLYQWRSREMQNFPDMLDVSAAGHLMAGETVDQGVREAEEELGLDLRAARIHKLGYRVEVADQSNGQRNREYQAVHMVSTPVRLEEFKPQVEEISGLYWIDIQEGISLFTGNAESVPGNGIFYNREAGVWERSVRQFNREKFLPRIQSYYLTAHIMAERLLQGKLPLAIS